MNLADAIKILRLHQKWRIFDGEIEDSPEMQNPKQIGIALELVLDELENKQ